MWEQTQRRSVLYIHMESGLRRKHAGPGVRMVSREVSEGTGVNCWPSNFQELGPLGCVKRDDKKSEKKKNLSAGGRERLPVKKKG